MDFKVKTQEELDEQIREITGEEPLEEESESDDERTVNTSDFGNQNESDVKPGEIEELIDELIDKEDTGTEGEEEGIL